MIKRTMREIADAIGGRLHRTDGSPVVTGSVEFDTRQVGPGDLFVAVPGERVDGHDFAEAAMRAGAVGVLATREVPAPAVIVPALDGDTTPRTDGPGKAPSVLAGLASLARSVVADLGRSGRMQVVGVTGSCGKTSTKDLIAQVLEPVGTTVAPPGSFNNELGHPWTVLRADEATRHLVLELAATAPGDIAALCRTAPPRVGVVLNVGSAHLGSFRSRDAIAQTKGELVEALPPAAMGGVAVLNADDPLVAAMVERTSAKVVRFGTHASADIRGVDVILDDQARARFRLVSPAGEAPVMLRLHGAHQVANALAAAAVGIELGAGVDQVAALLSQARRRSAHRMDVNTRADGVTVINDAYNANPESVRAALESLAAIAGARSRRCWAVLGPMTELGETEAEEHAEIGRLAMALGINHLLAVGDRTTDMYLAACREGSDRGDAILVPDADVATAVLDQRLGADDVVLVKASNTARLWRVAEALLPTRSGD
ncbi:UDP-N-acetylmuramoyl-tripeptide--D-alanyl-D-alanine ligase [Saccharopolyspora sp. ID03-671]|uniref:UDP-N-acetylmuramoyl-tripeptide--D-alanyl-D- alanine ligase n=1 Tax=Saccharopolyspora sp. ID03-671 TaxID=3073066 RepID=UPI003246185F